MLDRRALLRGGALLAGASAAGAVARPAIAAPSDVGTAFASTHVDGRRLGSVGVHWSVTTQRKAIALTFDDGPTARYTSTVLDILGEHKVRATFNVVGTAVRAHPELVRRAANAGHEIGNHTWSHADLARLDEAAAFRQLERAHEAIVAAAGTAPTQLRPPFGKVGGSTLLAAAQLGYPIVLWSMEFHERTLSSAEQVTHVAGRVQPGAIFLAHDGGPGPHWVGIHALAGMVAALRAKGYEFLTTSELLSLS